ncbi:MAP7 domain-containing protein 1-like [Uranotaenia lowii]|uniref:MAP7 domain-containing protein 1-like n=1 Tax=Uranotaenia lowii TaxID=190385 RepID=UPI00247A98D6|nr:MAP7 domain-containing protein 1-like [Uranotaenia lowii]
MELRSIHDVVKAKPADHQHNSGPTLAEEIASSSRVNPSTSSSGWRRIGNKMLWKPQQYWQEYDERKRKRAAQDKAAEKARRKQHKKQQHQQRQKEMFLSRKQQKQSRKQSSVKNSSKARATTDKELLAAAKVAFNRKSTPKAKIPTFINFQRGETLNPGPSSASPNVLRHRKRPSNIPAPPPVSPHLPNSSTYQNSSTMTTVPPAHPYATFNQPFTAPLVAPCCHHDPSALYFNPVMYNNPYFLPNRRVPM